MYINSMRYEITFPAPKRKLSEMKEWTTEVLACVYKMYGVEPTGFFSIRDLTFRVWFEY